MRRSSVFVLLAVAAVLALVGPATASVTVDDPLWEHQWGPRQVHADQSWDTSTGSGAVIAIVDSGVDRDHEDLAANVVGGNTFIDCGETGCGNGDWESGEDGGHPHGTHVAGIAAAVTGNATGIAGVAPDADIMPVKVLDQSGSGSFQDIGYGIRWAADNGADVINLSLGAYPGVQALELTGVISDAKDAIAYARSKGVVVVAAAGNEAFPLCSSPSFNDGALCVVATDKREAQPWYSNDAIKPDLLAVAAPGGAGVYAACYEEVVSTVPPGEGGDYCGYPSNLAYDEYAGTSMAAPHASGVAGLLAAVGCTDQQILDAMTSTARNPVTGARGTWDPVYGYGIVDADDALAAASCGGTTASETTTDGDASSDSGDGDGHGRPDDPGNGNGKEANRRDAQAA
ncbi:MAG: S8 family serine peptidase [Nitriliruptorales bacterium]|nr:S8 family serine peptidase [Nitriliruptorales bacterium]